MGKVFTLRATSRIEPRCRSFLDDEAVQHYEREVRVHRAYAEPWVLEPLDASIVDTTYRITGSSGASYRVDLLDGSGLHDACDCPDFASNLLGTCKHLEALRRLIDSRPGLRRAFAALDEAPRGAALTVDPRGNPCVVGRWTAVQKRALGLVLDDAGALRSLDAPVDATARPRGVRIAYAAVSAVARWRARGQLAARKTRISRAIERGTLGVDVLAHPLFPYQREGVARLVSAGRALLGDDMGLGKTVQALAACEVLRARGEASRVLVVTAASLKHQWAREIERYTGQAATVVGGGAASRREALESDVPYKVLNYELTWRELSTIRALDADVLVLDEAQRAKNFRTRTAATLRAIPSRFLFVLTGTPVENRLDDLYALLQLVDPSVLGPLWRFNLDFHSLNERGRPTGYKNLSALRERIAPVLLRRRKDEVLTQLPALTEQTRYAALTPAQAKFELDCRHTAAQLMSIAERRALSLQEQQRLLAALLKARQACNALELADPKTRDPASPKLDEFEALVGEVCAQGSAKVLVFSEWTEMLRLAAARLDALGLGYAVLHGGVPTEKRPALLERFRTDPELRVLLSTDAGGTGLNLQVASYVIHLDLPWNPGRLDQRTARAHRLGQTRGVSVIYLCAEAGIERGIEGTLAGKRAIRGAALDLASDVDEVETPTFSAFLRGMRVVLEATDAGAEGDAGEDFEGAGSEGEQPEVRALEASAERSQETREESVATPEPTQSAQPEVDRVAAEGMAETAAVPAETAAAPSAVTETAPAPVVESAPVNRARTRAQDRLRLARVVLEAGFAGDAVRAAYEALAGAIGGLLDAGVAPQGHGPLVAAVFRELVPTGRLPVAAHGVLARLWDLASLQAHDVAVDPAMARDAVCEAEDWVARLAAG